MTTKLLATDFAPLYTDAYDVLREARQGRTIGQLDARIEAILEVFEEEIGSLSTKAGRYLRRWATELRSGHLTLAGVHLDRAGLALGLKTRDLRQGFDDEPAQKASTPAPRVPAPAPRREDDDEILACLSTRDRSLVSLLPPVGQSLQGAAALAECWGGTMSPTSARGRYSRLASKLRDQCGRDVLLRGQGRYGRCG